MSGRDNYNSNTGRQREGRLGQAEMSCPMWRKLLCSCGPDVSQRRGGFLLKDTITSLCRMGWGWALDPAASVPLQVIKMISVCPRLCVQAPMLTAWTPWTAAALWVPGTARATTPPPRAWSSSSGKLRCQRWVSTNKTRGGGKPIRASVSRRLHFHQCLVCSSNIKDFWTLIKCWRLALSRKGIDFMTWIRSRLEWV